MYASGTAVTIPAEDLSISFLIDEETVEAGQLNQQIVVQTDSGRSITGNYAFKNALQLSRGPHSRVRLSPATASKKYFWAVAPSACSRSCPQPIS